MYLCVCTVVAVKCLYVKHEPLQFNNNDRGGPKAREDIEKLRHMVAPNK